MCALVDLPRVGSIRAEMVLSLKVILLVATTRLAGLGVVPSTAELCRVGVAAWDMVRQPVWGRCGRSTLVGE